MVLNLIDLTQAGTTERKVRKYKKSRAVEKGSPSKSCASSAKRVPPLKKKPVITRAKHDEYNANKRRARKHNEDDRSYTLGTASHIFLKATEISPRQFSLSEVVICEGEKIEHAFANTFTIEGLAIYYDKMRSLYPTAIVTFTVMKDGGCKLPPCKSEPCT